MYKMYICTKMYVYIKYDKNPQKLSMKINLSCRKLINLSTKYKDSNT